MEKKRSVWKIVAVVAALVFVGVVCFFVGRSVESEQQKAARELEIQINRSELDELKLSEGPIYVTGHKTPDTDTVASAIAYAALLKGLGYDARPAVLGGLKRDSKYVFEKGGLEVPERLGDVTGKNMVLVDHSEYAQSAEDLSEANLITVIDHHGIGTVTTGNLLLVDTRPIGSTATIIWLRYRNYGLVPDQKTAFAMVGAILSDTKNLKSQTTLADREALKELSAIAGISDTNALYAEMYKASISYDGMTDEEIFLSDYKDYEVAGQKYGIACVNAYDEKTAKNLSERMKKVMADNVEQADRKLLFAQVSIYHDDISVVYLVPVDQEAEKVVELAFEDHPAFDGTAYRFEPGFSRKQVLVPAINKALESLNVPEGQAQ